MNRSLPAGHPTKKFAQNSLKSIYKWYISGIYCQLGDGLCHRSHLLGESETTIDETGNSLKLQDPWTSNEAPTLSFRQRRKIRYRTSLNDLCFCRSTHQNKAFSKQNKGHLGSRYIIYIYIYIGMLLL